MMYITSQFCALVLLGVALSHMTHVTCETGEVNVTRLQEVMTTLARQTMMQQLSMEERIRGSGHSGIKQVRAGKDGNRDYLTSSHIGGSAAAIHDHADHYKTVGIGEVIAVMNGVDFRSRHNDYMLRSPSRTSTDYKAMDDIEYPAVPPEVLEKDGLDDQVLEMRKWFKAWADQDDSERDYKKYFKPLLCYLEGAWTETDFGVVEEPFESDRHHVSASNWYDLQEKIRYTSYTGSKDKGENYAFLPTKIVDIDETTKEPIYAQWNYRILCHQLEDDLPLNMLQQNDDLHARLKEMDTMSEFSRTRQARYIINRGKPTTPRRYRWDVLEALMNQVPGLDNYPADIEDKSFGNTYLDPFSRNDKVLNAGYYHSWYRFKQSDAMGLLMGRRGFSDMNLFFAFNERPEVSPRSVRYCEGDECASNHARVSYAMPMEIVWLTPLNSWNPYDIEMKSGKKTGVETSTRKGGFTKATAFDGNDGRHFYRTPHEFFTGAEVEADAADTAFSVAGVLDSDGNVRNVTASGVRIFLPEIPGIEGNLRTRYPIFPIHEEGSTAYKDIKALQEIVMDIKTYMKMFVVKPSGVTSEQEETTPIQERTLFMTPVTANPPGAHTHSVTLNAINLGRLRDGKSVTMETTQAAGHTHKLKFKYFPETKEVLILRCDNKSSCWDGHEMVLHPKSDD